MSDQPRSWRRGRRTCGRLAAVLLLLLPLAALAHDTPQPIAVTEGGSQVVSVSAGSNHSCGVLSTGEVECWGSNGNGQVGGPPSAPVPVHTGPYVSVSAGWSHSCGVLSTGEVECWGDNYSGQVGGAPTIQPPYTATVTHDGPYVSVSAGWTHSCGVLSTGEVECWGYNGNGQVGGPPSAPVPVHTGPYVSVSAGYGHSCGVLSTGEVECWGDNGNGQVGGTSSAPVPVHDGPYVSVSAGGAHSCGVLSTGAVECWGWNGHGQVGGPPTTGTHAGPYVSVSVGLIHSCGVKADGSVTCWGAGGPETSGFPHFGQSTVPGTMSAVGSAAFGQIAAGNAHACQVKPDGRIACWGDNTDGQANAPAGQFTQVVAGDSHSCAIGTDGKFTCWGRDSAALMSNPHIDPNMQWRQLAPAPNGAICALHASTSTSYCFRGSGQNLMYVGIKARNITFGRDLEPFGWAPSPCGASVAGVGGCSNGFDGAHSSSNFPGPWQRLESGLNHQCGLKANGSIECWGASADDQMTGLTQLENDATPLWGLAGPFRAFSVGWNHACAIRDNGQLACWGSNINGQATPPSGTFVQVAAGNTFSCAIRSNGTRVCWGDDVHGQAPQLVLSPAGITDGVVGTAYAGASFALSDAGPNADGDYVPQTPAFAIVDGSLPPDLELAVDGTLSGTPTTVGTFTFTVEGEDANGFTASREYTIVIADPTPPEIGYVLAPAAPDGDNGWYVSDVGIDWTVSDAESEITASTGCDDSTLASDTLGARYTCTATSAGGSKTVETVKIRRDATAPTLAPTVPGLILAGGSASANPNASDALSGIASASCTPLETGSAGTKTATCTATDNAGNSASATVRYTVVAAQFQWQQPLLPVVYKVNANQRVLLQWRLVNTQGGWVTNLSEATVTSTAVGCPGAFALNLPAYTGTAIDLQHVDSGIYRKTWQVASGAPGSCLRMHLDVGDGKPHTVLFKLK